MKAFINSNCSFIDKKQKFGDSNLVGVFLSPPVATLIDESRRDKTLELRIIDLKGNFLPGVRY